MRVIVAGGRDIFAPGLVFEAINESGFAITTVVSGGAQGVDLCGEVWADQCGVPVDRHPADWQEHRECRCDPEAPYCKAAGFRRNRAMAKVAEALILVWDGISRGSRDMLDQAKREGLKIFVYRVTKTPKGWVKDRSYRVAA
jgi:hypothetical protein